MGYVMEKPYLNNPTGLASCQKNKHGKERLMSRQGIPLLLVLNRPCLDDDGVKVI